MYINVVSTEAYLENYFQVLPGNNFIFAHPIL